MPTDPTYHDIGELLRKARKERHLELEGVAQALHIRVRYLDALEAGRLSELPGLSYAKGYLQVYASFIGLDKEEILRRFEDVEAQLGRRGFYFPQVFRKEKTADRWLIWGGLAAAALAYLLWVAATDSSRFATSLVEPFPHEEAKKAPVLTDNGPCFESNPALYPPCTMAHNPWVSLVSLQARAQVAADEANQQNAVK